MRSVVADLWSFVGVVEHVCVTTNGDVNSGGRAVMGRGCALQAAKKWREAPIVLGELLRHRKNTPHILGLVGSNASLWNRGDMVYDTFRSARREHSGSMLWSFPVKHHWHEQADIRLIVRSAALLRYLIDEYDPYTEVVIPRPGCGNGALRWEDVEPAIEPILDDRFIIVSQ